MALSPRLRIPGNWPGASILPENGISAPRWVFLVTNQVPPFQEWHSALISVHVETNSTVTSEWLSTHIWHGRNQILSTWQNGSTLTSDHGRNLILSPCQNGSRSHHFPLEGTSIWRTPSFSLKYSNLTLAISSIESHQGWLRPMITCKLRQDWLHPRTTYRTIYV